ncbi:MAG: GTP-binding protein [Planctomycetota bacterium]
MKPSYWLVHAKRWLLFLCIAIGQLGGCTNADRSQPPVMPESAASARDVRVALLGDETRVELLGQLADVSGTRLTGDGEHVGLVVRSGPVRVDVTTEKSNTVTTHATSCWNAELAAICVDARNGPMPVHREHILFARQMHVPNLMVAFTHAEAIDDLELLELEELEMRELLNAYGWNGDEAFVIFDSNRANRLSSKAGHDWPEALVQSFAQARGRHKLPPVVKVSSCSAEIYVLAKGEAFPLKASTLSSGKYLALFGDSSISVQIRVDSAVEPGTTASAHIDFGSPFQIHPLQRFVIVINGHVAAVGVVPSPEQ